LEVLDEGYRLFVVGDFDLGNDLSVAKVFFGGYFPLCF
jgi:ribosome-binding factor A